MSCTTRSHTCIFIHFILHSHDPVLSLKLPTVNLFTVTFVHTSFAARSSSQPHPQNLEFSSAALRVCNCSVIFRHHLETHYFQFQQAFLTPVVTSPIGLRFDFS